MILLLASVLALLAGPALYRAARRGIRLAALDWSIVVVVTVLVVAELVRDVRDENGWVTIGLAGLGLLAPTAVESLLHRIRFHRIETTAHWLTLLAALTGLAVHGTVDGTVLASGDAADLTLRLAIVVHRIPVGLAVWWLLRPPLGPGWAWVALALLAGSTAGGFVAGPTVLATLSSGVGEGFQAVVAGSLLHVVLFRTHTDLHTH